MRFTEIEAHIDMDLLCWRSEGGVWDLGFKRRLFGVAVCLGRAGRGDEVAYCFGSDGMLALRVFQEMRVILLMVDENSALRIIRQQFPVQQRKPMKNDPETRQAIHDLCMTAILEYLDSPGTEDKAIPSPIVVTHAGKLAAAFIERGSEICESLETELFAGELNQEAGPE